FQLIEDWNLIREKTVEMMFHMRKRIETLLVTVPVIRRKHETIQVFCIRIDLIAVEMLQVGNVHAVRINETTNRCPVMKLSTQFEIHLIRNGELPFVEV